MRTGGQQHRGEGGASGRRKWPPWGGWLLVLILVAIQIFPHNAKAEKAEEPFMYYVSNAGADAATFTNVFWENDKYWYQEVQKQEITSWTITVGDDAFGRLDYLEEKEAMECWTHNTSDRSVQVDLSKVMRRIYGDDVKGLAQALGLVKELGGTYINLYVHISYTVRDTPPDGAESAGTGAGQPSSPPAAVASPEAEVKIENVGALTVKWGWREIASGTTITLPKNEMAALAKERLAVANPAGGRPAEAYRYTTNRIVPSQWEPEKKERYEIAATELGMPTVVVRNDGEVAIEVRGKTVPAGGDASFRTTAALSKEIIRFSAKPNENEKERFDWEGGEVSVDWADWGGTNTVSVRAKQTAKRVAPKKTDSPPITPPISVSLPVEPTPKPVEEVKHVEPKPVEPVPEPVHKVEIVPPLPEPKISPPVTMEKPRPEPEIPPPVVVEKPRKKTQEAVVPKPVNPEEAKGKINGDWPGLEEWEEGEDLPRLRRMSEGMTGLKGSGAQGGGLPDWNTMQRFLHACDDYAKRNGMASNTAREILDVMGNCQGWDEFLGRRR